MATNQSSWKVGQWTTPTTTVTTQPVPSEVTAESKSQISHNIPGQFASFIQDEYPTFIEFVKAYYKSQELRGYCFDIINNWGDYYNIDNYGDLVVETDLISSMSATSTTVDVTTTRDFPNEGLLMIDDEIIYYKNKGQTIFNDCARGIDAIKAVGDASQYVFAETTASTHDVGAKVINLNNIFPLFMLGQFKDQYLSTYPKNFADGITESTVIKRIKDFYASKGTTRSFQFVLRTLFGVESVISYPRDRIFKPSDAFYTSREVIRATAVSGDPTALVGEILYQENDPSDPYVNEARIYVKGVQKVFTSSGEIFEIDVDTNNSTGTFVTPYKTTVASDVSNSLDFTTITVDSTLGWPEQNGKFRIQNEIISYASKTVNQFLGCTRAREGTIADEHIAGQEAFAAFKIYGQSNVDGSEIQIKVFGGTRGVNLTDGGKYYLPQSKVTTPRAPGFDSLDPIWSSFQYNVRKALRGVTAELSSPAADGSVRVTVTTREKHRLRRDDKVRILNAAEDIYNNEHDVIGIINEFKFEFILSSAPSASILETDPEFFISREFAFGTSVYTSINNAISKFTSDVQNVYRSSTDAIVASTGIPSHPIGPFASDAPDVGNQRYLKRIPLVPSTKSTKTPTPIGQIGIGVNGVPFFSYKGNQTKKYGGITSITKVSGGDGYDILNPPTVEFEPNYKLDTNYPSGIIVKHNDNGVVRRYRAVTPGVSSKTAYPTHTTGTFQVGTVIFEFLGLSAAATAVIDGRVIAINVTNGGSGYTTQPIVSITGGGASNSTQATGVAQITDGRVTGITVTSSGSGYTLAAGLPTITITGGGGAGASATAVVRGPIDAINITDAGTQYTYEPSITLKSGSGAVGYASILNGKIESIIITFGGADYFGAPDVVITGDGVGATAFAVVTNNQVTAVTVTNKGIGYSTGNTQIDLVYPGTGANFTTNLTTLTYNEAATEGEIKSNDPTATFTDRKTVDDASGTVVTGENIGIYDGEYGYFYNPNNLRYYLGDSVVTRIPTIADPSPWIEQTPTAHSPIIGWAYDGHPIYGPYGFEDPQNQNPYNSYVQPATSYRIKASRASVLSGLTDPMGTFIEDYEYVEGLGNLDRYNGRYCVTPEYPNGVYAYFCTIDGVSGKPKFPYFVGPNFYSEANEVNWDGNGLQKNFTEDAIRFRAPYIGTDNVTAKRKTLDARIDFVLAMEDSTTLITLETGEVLQYIEDGIGYYSYYPTIRGGVAESLSVAATNRYSSNNINDYLVEGGGSGYKVNDRLIFDNNDTGGDGVSGTVSTVTGEIVNSLNYVVGDDDVTIATLTTADKHYLVGGDAITVSIGDNSYEREISVLQYYNKFYFKYFNLVSMDLLTAWSTSTAYNKYDLVFVADRVYQAAITGTSDSDANNAPSHLTGTVTDGSMTWTYIRRRTDGAVIATTTNSLGTGYNQGIYTDVPMKTNNSGKDLVLDLTVSVQGGGVTVTAVKTRGTAFKIGDTITVENVNVGGSGSGFQLTVSEISLEAVCRTDVAHQVKSNDIVWFSGMNDSAYLGDSTVVRSETARRFTILVNNYNASTPNPIITSAVTSVREPQFQFINGHSYKFDTSSATLNGATLAFSFDPSNTDIFTYKNITDEVIDTNTNQQTSITVKMLDLPGIFYYFDLSGTYASAGSYFTIMNEPLSGTNVLLSKTDTTASYVTALEPEVGYDTSNSVTYSTNSIYPTGGVSTISIGDSGRNYESLPQLTGSSRSGAGATAVATIAGALSGVAVTNKGSGYDPNSLPTGVVTLPDFVDLTLTNVLGSGSFAVNEIVISQSVQGSQTARGRVLNWNPLTSTLRIQPLQNARNGAANKGYIMFTTLSANADRGRVFSSETQASISAVSGTQAVVLCSIPSSGPDVGKLSEVTIVGPGSNYRSAPDIILDLPEFGLAKTVILDPGSTQPTGLTPGDYTGVTQLSASPVGGINIQLTVKVGVGGTIETLTVTNGGSNYKLGSEITIAGNQIGGSSTNAVVKVTELTHVDVATTLSSLNGSVDSITITNSGSGYLSAPEVLVSGGSGINAKFNATIKDQGISSINIESGGQLFQNAPVVNILQKTGTGASVLLKSSNLGEILKIGGDNITFNYSHDRTLKPELNTTYNLQLTRTQVIDYLDVTDGGANFVAIPEIVLTGGSGSLFVLEPVIENEVIQSVNVTNPGRGFLSAPTVNAKVTHNWVALRSSSTLNFPYNAKIPTGTKVTLNQNVGVFPDPLTTTTTYYAIAATLANGLADNQIRLATTLSNAINETYINFTSDPQGDANGLTSFTLSSIDLGDSITAYMKAANFLVGERVYQGTSTTSFTAYGIIKNWDRRGRVLSVEIIEGDFVVGEPVFGAESSAFGEIHAFDRAEATFNVSPISTSAEGWSRTTGFLDVNEQRLYDSDRFQEYSYEISSPINISKWKNPVKFAAHPAGFKVVGTQVVLESSAKVYRAKSTLNPNYSSNEPWAWWVSSPQSSLQTLNGTTYVFPKPSAKSTGKFSTIANFALGDPDYSAAVPTEVQIFGRQLLDVQKILSCIAHKIDNISSGFNGSTRTFNLRVDGVTVTTKIGKTSIKEQFLVMVNGIVQNPNNYIVSNDTITFSDAPKESSVALIMYYDRASYTSSFQLDQIGDEIKSFGTGYSGMGVHTFVSGVTNAITASGGASGSFTAASGTTYDPSTGVLVIEIGSHSLTTSNTVTIADGGITFTCDADNHASEHAYPRIGDPASNKTLTITAETATTITVNVGISNDDPAELVPGRGYSDGVYNAVRLKNKRGSGTGATANITVTDGSVTNVKLVNPGNGYTADDIVGIANPVIGEQLVKPFLPTNGTYNPSTGDMVLTIGSGHGLTAATTHTPTGATYDPQTGLMVVTIPNHGLENGDQVKFADGAITFSCGYNGGGNESYPRSTDYISGKWILALDCTTNTFTVQVLNTFPSTNTDAHTYVTAGSNSVSFARSTVRIANESLQFSCGYNGGGTASYPRETDPIGTRGRQRDVPVEAVSTNTITVNALNGTTPTNTDAHTWVGLSPYQFTPTNAHYTPHNGQIIFTLAGHPFRKGDRIKLATNSLTFTCIRDDNATNHTYPRVGDPAEDTWLTVDKRGDDVFSVFVGATDEIYKTYQPTTGTVYYPGGSGTANQPPNGNWEEGNIDLEIGAHNLQVGDHIKIKQNSLVFTCDYNGDNFQTEKTYPRQPDAEDIWSNDGDTASSLYPEGTVNTWIPILKRTATSITVYVGDAGFPASNNEHRFVRADADAISASAHAFVSADNNCIERAVVAYGNYKLSKTADAARLIRNNVDRIARTAYSMMALDGANNSFSYGLYRDKCIRDTKLLINAVANNVEFGGNDQTYDAAQLYVDTIHLQGEEGQSVQVFNNAKELCVEVMRNRPARTISNNILWINSNYTSDSTLWVSDGQNYGNTLYTGSGDGGYGQKGPVNQNQFFDHSISVDDDDNDYRPKGRVTSIGNFSGSGTYNDGTWFTYSNRDYVRHSDGSMGVGYGAAFNVTISGGAITNIVAYPPGSSDDLKGDGYEVGDVIYMVDATQNAGESINIDVDESKIIKATVTGIESISSSNYPTGYQDPDGLEDPQAINPTTGQASRGNFYANSGETYWKYSTNSCQDVESTIRSLWGIVTQAVGTGAHTFVNSASSNNITVTGGGSGPFTAVAPTTYDNTTGLMEMEIGSHSLTTSDTVTITANSLVFTCTNDGNRSQKTYPRASDPAYNTAVAITAVTGTTITVNVGTNTGNLTGIVRSAATTPDFQVGVADVAFDGNDKTFTMTSGGSTQVLPASDNFLIFLNSTLQLKGTTQSYTYTGSELTFTEAPLAGMDFYGFYFGKLVLLDEISPFFDNSKQTFTMKLDNEPFSLESDNEDVVPANNLMIFINGVFQEPGVAYSLNGSIIKFSEAPRANSTCSLFIYTGSDADIFVSNTFNSIDPGDRMQVASEGSDRLIATVSSASSVDTYEYVGLRPNTATFTAQITNGSVTGVIIDDPGSNYENPPILLFQGGSGVGASATTTIQSGSGQVNSVNITDGGTGYLSVPTVVPVHPVDMERKSRDRIISNSLALGCTYLTTSINSTDTTIQCRNIYYDTTQRYGFPDEGEVLIPFYDTTVTPNRWNVERILYGATNTSANTLTVATGGRGYRGTTAAAHTVLTGTYNSTGTACTVTTSTNHNYVTGMRVFLDFTSGPTIHEVNWGPDGEYAVTVTGSTTFTVEFPFSRTASGNVSVLPEVRLRSL